MQNCKIKGTNPSIYKAIFAITQKFQVLNASFLFYGNIFANVYASRP